MPTEMTPPPLIEISNSHAERMLRDAGFLSQTEEINSLVTQPDRLKQLQKTFPLVGQENRERDGRLFKELIMVFDALDIERVLGDSPSPEELKVLTENPVKRKEYLAIKLAVLDLLYQQLAQINIEGDIYILDKVLNSPASETKTLKLEGHLTRTTNVEQKCQNWLALWPYINEGITKTEALGIFEANVALEERRKNFSRLISVMEKNLSQYQEIIRKLTTAVNSNANSSAAQTH